MAKTSRNVGGFVGSYIGYVISALSTFLAFLVYEKSKNKDNTNIATTLAILMTKVDALVSIKETVDKHDEMLIRHDVEIKTLKDTNRFAKITEELLKGGIKND